MSLNKCAQKQRDVKGTRTVFATSWRHGRQFSSYKFVTQMIRRQVVKLLRGHGRGDGRHGAPRHPGFISDDCTSSPSPEEIFPNPFPFPIRYVYLHEMCHVN